MTNQPNKHQFKKGKSGNPTGRPVRIDKDILQHLPSLLAILIGAYNGDKGMKQKWALIKEVLHAK